MFYLLLLLTVCLIRYTIIFEILILSSFIMMFLSSTVLDHREAGDPVPLIEKEKNTQLDEIDIGPKEEVSKGKTQESKQSKVDDKIAKLGMIRKIIQKTFDKL